MSHKKTFQRLRKLNDLETRPSKAFLTAPKNSSFLPAATPDGRVNQAERRRGSEESLPGTALCCLAMYLLPCLSYIGLQADISLRFVSQNKDVLGHCCVELLRALHELPELH